MGDKTEFSRQDTLRGSITKERSWWDLNRYHLDIIVKPEEKFISGSNKISYTVLKSHDLMQIDLQTPLRLTKATQDNSELEIIHDGNAHFIKLKKKQNVGSKEEIVVYYEGNPRVAVRARGMVVFHGKKIKMEIILLHLLVRVWELVFGGLIKIICMMNPKVC